MPVNTPHRLIRAMADKWARLRDCASGRDAIIAGGARYLPRLEGTQKTDYYTRGNFYNATARTVQGLAGAISQRPPTLDADVSLKAMAADVTAAGMSLEEFAREVTAEVVQMAYFGVLVDVADVVARPEGLTAATRPYLVPFKAEQIINFRTERIEGAEHLVFLVLRADVEEPDPQDEFATKVTEAYRVLRLTVVNGARVYSNERWQLAEAGDKAARPSFTRVSEAIPVRNGKPLDFIPFYFCGASNTNPEPDSPPLIDLADVNLAHWRNSSDHEWGLHMVALPTPWIAGAALQDGEKLSLGPSNVLPLPIGATAGMLEFTGSGLGAIERALERKERQMAVIGARMLEDQANAPETATAVAMRHSGEQVTLRSICQSIGRCLTSAMQAAGWWMSTAATPADVRCVVEMNQRFFVVKASPDEVRTALMLLQAEKITYDTFWHFIATGGWTPEGRTAGEELEELAKQGDVAPDDAGAEGEGDGETDDVDDAQADEGAEDGTNVEGEDEPEGVAPGRRLPPGR